MLVLLQGKEKKQYSKPLGWPNEKWSSERRLSNDLKVGEIVGGSNFQQQITIDYIYIYIYSSVPASPPVILSAVHQLCLVQKHHYPSSNYFTTIKWGFKTIRWQDDAGILSAGQTGKNEVPLTRFMVAALLRYASANSDASSHMASRTTGYNLPVFFQNESQAPIQPWILHYHRMQLMRGNACILIILLHLVHGSNFYSAKRSLGGERLSYLGFCSRACLAGFLAHLPLACWSWMNPRHQKMPGILTVHLLRLLMVM